MSGGLRRAAPFVVAISLAVGAFLLALGAGAHPVRVGRTLEIFRDLLGGRADPRDIDVAVIAFVRGPRVVLGAGLGAALATGGATLQAVVRNPLADAGLLGIASGAAMAVVATLVAADRLGASAGIAPWMLPIAGATGGVVSAACVWWAARAHGRLQSASLLLAGVAVNALAGALVGLLQHVATDAALRSANAWLLGSLAGATWSNVAIVMPLFALGVGLMPVLGPALDAMSLGEREASHMGVRVERVQAVSLALTIVSVAAGVAFVGVVGFVGLVVPHVARMWVGPGHRRLLVLSPILGAALVLAADLAARTIAAPAELPLGVITAILGAPFFLMLIVRRRREEIA